MDVKRYRPDDPELQGRDVVLASDFDRLQKTLNNADTLCGELMASSSQHEEAAGKLRNELAAVRALSKALDSDASLTERMKAAGMLTVSEILAGAPLDAFMRHVGVCDLDTFAQWVEMRRAEYVKLHARFALEKREDDELFEWIMAHAAVYGEVMINLKAAMPKAEPLSQPPTLGASILSGTDQ